MAFVMVAAPGKVILHGEHAVVYGKKALAMSLNCETTVRMDYTDNAEVKLYCSAGNLSLYKTFATQHINEAIERLATVISEEDMHHAFPWKHFCAQCHKSKSSATKPSLEHSRDGSAASTCPAATAADLTAVNHAQCDVDVFANSAQHHPNEQILEEARKLVGVGGDVDNTHSQGLVALLYLFLVLGAKAGKVPSVVVNVGSDLSPGAGLGSSAAFSTGLAAVLLYHSGALPKSQDDGRWTAPDHLRLINSWAFIGEKIIHGQPSGVDNTVSCYGGGLTFQSGVITHLDNVQPMKVLLTNTNVSRSTKQLVAAVRERCQKMPEVMHPILDSIEAITEKRLQMLKDPSTAKTEDVNELVRINQSLLRALGVSHPTLDTVECITTRYSLATKLTGAGGGGCAVTILRDDMDVDELADLQGDLEEAGFEVSQNTLGGPGIRCIHCGDVPF